MRQYTNEDGDFDYTKITEAFCVKFPELALDQKKLSSRGWQLLHSPEPVYNQYTEQDNVYLLELMSLHIKNNKRDWPNITKDFCAKFPEVTLKQKQLRNRG
jgi:hypothetical protein